MSAVRSESPRESLASAVDHFRIVLISCSHLLIATITTSRVHAAFSERAAMVCRNAASSASFCKGLGDGVRGRVLKS